MKRLNLIVTVLGLFFTAGLWAFLLFTPYFADPDVFYHAALAQYIWQGKSLNAINWLPYTQFANGFVDMHWAYHLWLAIWQWLPYPWAIKIPTWIAAVLAFLALPLTLRALGSRMSWLGVWLPWLYVPGLFRLGLVKATTLAWINIGALMCLLEWRPKQKSMGYIRLAGIATMHAVAILLYSGFPLLLVVLGSWLIVQRVFKVISWREVGGVSGASALGLLIGWALHPNAAAYVAIWKQQFIDIGLRNFQSEISVGGEWLPYAPSDLLFGLLPVTAASLILMVFIVAWRVRVTHQFVWLSILALGSLLITFKSRRYVEYATLFHVLWFIIALDVVWRAKAGHLVRWLEHAPITKRITTIGLAMILCIIIIPVWLLEAEATVKQLRSGDTFGQVTVVANWLRDEFPTNQYPNGVLVIQSDWDEFPQLVQEFPEGRYIAGLDPTFTYRHNREVYLNWSNITQGKFTPYETNVWLTQMNAQAAVISQSHKAMYNLIDGLECSKLGITTDTYITFRLQQPCWKP